MARELAARYAVKVGATFQIKTEKARENLIFAGFLGFSQIQEAPAEGDGF